MGQTKMQFTFQIPAVSSDGPELERELYGYSMCLALTQHNPEYIFTIVNLDV